MGLPLFVAPVESDLPSKSAAKNRAISPLPAGVQSRRHARQWSRERRAAIVRRIARERMSNGEGPDRLPWIESSLPGDREAIPTPSTNTTTTSQPPARPRRPFRDVLRDMGHLRRTLEEEQVPWESFDNRRAREREQFSEERQAFLAAQNSDNFAGLPIEGVDLSTFASVSLPRQRRARFTDPSPVNADDAFRLRQMIQPERQPTGPDSNWASAAIRRRRRFEPEAATGTTEPRPTRRRTTASRADINGLGDRERSLSPEVWDTLLTTLTPDPQPPSAGSSFASAVVSQNTGVSSSTSATTAPAVVDPACESGHENSDTEGPLEELNFGRLRTRRQDRQEAQEEVDEFGQDSDEAPPYHRSAARAGRSGSGPPPAGRRFYDPFTSNASNPVTDATARVVGGRNVFPTPSWEGRPDPTEAFTIPQLNDQPNGWIGQLSVGASDDEPGTESRRLNQESSAVSGNATSQGEDDWEGMQRIVRSLARREDIPDEWWAEAGLSRNLP